MDIGIKKAFVLSKYCQCQWSQKNIFQPFFAIQNFYEESEKFYLKAIQLKRKAVFWNNLGVLYHRWNKTEKAAEAYKNAISLDNNSSAKEHLRKIKIEE